MLTGQQNKSKLVQFPSDIKELAGEENKYFDFNVIYKQSCYHSKGRAD